MLGHDLVWCGIVERGLLKLSGNKLLANNQNYNDWRDSESTCKVKEDLPFIVPGYDSDQTLADRPVTCAIIHATPVVHLDTKAESDSKKGSLGHADGEAFRKAFPDAFYFQNCSSYDETYWFKVKDGGKIWLDRGQFRYWRSFTTDEEPCQSCKSHECIADLLLVDK